MCMVKNQNSLKFQNTGHNMNTNEFDVKIDEAKLLMISDPGKAASIFYDISMKLQLKAFTKRN